jgi:hypothetical protein
LPCLTSLVRDEDSVADFDVEDAVPNQGFKYSVPQIGIEYPCTAAGTKDSIPDLGKERDGIEFRMDKDRPDDAYDGCHRRLFPRSLIILEEPHEPVADPGRVILKHDGSSITGFLLLLRRLE